MDAEDPLTYIDSLEEPLPEVVEEVLVDEKAEVEVPLVVPPPLVLQEPLAYVYFTREPKASCVVPLTVIVPLDVEPSPELLLVPLPL